MAKEVKTKLPSEREITDLDILRKTAKNSRNPKVLQELIEKHSYDEYICWYVAKNSAANSKTREVLAKHENPKVRYCIAQHSEEIESEKALIHLALDDRLEIREQVARTTTRESIKELLLKGNPHNEKIRKICLKRLREMDVLEKFIRKASKGDLFKYAESILSNPNLTRHILLLFITASDRLSNEHINLIVDHIQYNKKYFEESLTRFGINVK